MGDVGQTFTGLSGKTKKDFGHGNANYVTYLNVFNNTITDKTDLDQIEIDPNQNSVSYGDVFFTTSSETPEEVGMSSVWLENTENIYLNSFCFGYRPREIFDSFFLAYLLRSPSLRKQFTLLAQGISRYNISKTKAMEIVIDIPTLNEQNYIGELFFNIDNLITRHQRKLEKMKELKKSYLSEMFPAEGERKPKRRFAGFTDDWEQRKLGDVGSCQSGIGFPENEQGGKKGTPFYKVSDMNNDGNELEMSVANNYVTDEQLRSKNWKPITELPAIIFAKVGAAIMLNRKRLCAFPFLLDNNLMAYKFDKSWETYFGKTLFEKIDLTSLVQVGALPSYNAVDVENIVISISKDKTEQQKIGALFKILDNLITLHQRKLEKLKNIKKAYLNEMFPRTERE